MAFGFDRRARSRKARGGIRSLFGKAPDVKELGDRLPRLAKRIFKSAVEDTGAKHVTVKLNAAAPPVRIDITDDSELHVRGITATIGPGYHGDIARRLVPILEELEYEWVGEEENPQRAFASWVADELAGGAKRIGMPTERNFKIDATVCTPLGPRGVAWVDAVIEEPAKCADAFPWWDDAAGTRERARALLAMWHDVPWREPVTEDERALMEAINADLTAARDINPQIDLPYADWYALLQLYGADDDEHAEEIKALAGKKQPTIGYRRHAMDVELSGGWSIELGGAFVGHWEDDDARWWATDGDRVVEFSSLTAPDETDSAKLLAVAPERFQVIARVEESQRCGRAEAQVDDGVHIVHGLMTSAPNVAIMTFKGSKDDEAWALGVWRSLKLG